MNCARALNGFAALSFALSLSFICHGAEERLRLAVGADVYTLHTFDSVNPSLHYFGRYAFRNELTGGTRLHLFPGGRFVISEWVDIGGDKPAAEGTYEVLGTRLVLRFSKIRLQAESIASRFDDLHLAWGWIEKPGYVTGSTVFIFPKQQWEKLNEGSKDVRYMRRTVEYNDWERILRAYSERLDKQGQ